MVYSCLGKLMVAKLDTTTVLMTAVLMVYSMVVRKAAKLVVKLVEWLVV